MKKTLLFCLMACLSLVIRAEIASGICGDNVNWTISDDYVLTLSGSGSMAKYNNSYALPWYYEYSKDIKSVIVQNGITGISNYAFYGCSAMTSVTIPSSVTSIGYDAFYNCSSLEKADFASVEALCKINFSDYASNPLFFAHHLYVDGQEIKDLVIPSSITEIRYLSFYGCSGLNSVTIPNSVTSIGSYAFGYCTGLKTLTIPNSVASIGYDAFSECYFTEDSYNNQSSEAGRWGATICDEETEDGLLIKNNMIWRCRPSSSTVNIPTTVSTIAGGAFSGCYGLTSITIPSTITEISAYVFSECKNLSTVTVLSSSTSIDNNAFEYCSNLKEFVNLSSTPQNINSNTFDNTDLSTATLYVPEKSIDTYKTANVWSSFGSIRPVSELYSYDVNHDGKVDIQDITILVDHILGKSE